MSPSSNPSSDASNASAKAPAAAHDAARFGLFEAVGVEIEYMIVDALSLDVRPLADRLLAEQSGLGASDAEFEDITWSNELVNHVIELKTTDPATCGLGALRGAFESHVRRINAQLAGHGARLMPGAMHPWMDPHRETVLWPHEAGEIYKAFHHIFDCRGHGWANLQSTHVNLPFRGDEEFARLHAAIRLVLPILPALAAASPVMDGRATGLLDTRLDVYRHNCDRVPQCTGRVIPEAVFSIDAYHETILQPIYEAIAPHDTDEILREEWVNARGAIARFDRNTIEIRVIDAQECPAADLAIVSAVVAVLKALADERWSTLAAQKGFSTDALADIFDRTIREADRAVIENADYLRAFGLTGGPATAGDVWRRALGHVSDEVAHYADELDVLTREGPLAARLLQAGVGDPSRQKLQGIYASLCDAADSGRMLRI